MLLLKYTNGCSVLRGIFIFVFLLSACVCQITFKLKGFPFLCLLPGWTPPFAVEHLHCVKQDYCAGSSSKPHCWTNQPNAFHGLLPFKTTSSKLTFLFSIIRWKALKYPVAISACTLFWFYLSFFSVGFFFFFSMLQLLYSLEKRR